MTWGGRRPGAGARKGNTNAIKHGMRSQRIRRAVDKVMTDSDIQALLHVLSNLAPDELERYLETLAAYARKHRKRLSSPEPPHVRQQP